MFGRRMVQICATLIVVIDQPIPSHASFEPFCTHILSRWVLLLGVGILVMLTGCAGHKRPGVVVSDATLADRSQRAAVVEFVIDATNPNEYELPVRSIVYSLSIDGQSVFSTRREGLVSLPRHGSESITIPAVVPMGESGIQPGVHAYTLTGIVRYSLPSKLADVLYDSRISRPSVAITDRGTIDLR